jgi:hypothetical protein
MSEKEMVTGGSCCARGLLLTPLSSASKSRWSGSSGGESFAERRSRLAEVEEEATERVGREKEDVNTVEARHAFSDAVKAWHQLLALGEVFVVSRGRHHSEQRLEDVA